jgi:hypothetical protein
VVAALPRASRVEVDLLERADMNTLVTSAGVTSHRARAVVLSQADGRPGWALTLCGLLAAGEDDEVATGGALDECGTLPPPCHESRTALDTLACVAALKGVTAETLYALAPLVGEPPAAMSGLMDRLARNGLVDGADGVWRLQPALCAPHVAQWFFTSPAQRPWSTLQSAFPQSALELASSMLQAARCPPPVLLERRLNPGSTGCPSRPNGISAPSSQCRSTPGWTQALHNMR